MASCLCNPRNETTRDHLKNRFGQFVVADRNDIGMERSPTFAALKSTKSLSGGFSDFLHTIRHDHTATDRSGKPRFLFAPNAGELVRYRELL